MEGQLMMVCGRILDVMMGQMREICANTGTAMMIIGNVKIINSAFWLRKFAMESIPMAFLTYGMMNH